MSPQGALVLAVAIGTLFSLFSALLFRECIGHLEMQDRRAWIILLYFTSPLEGAIILLSIYFGIDSAALSEAAAAFIALLIGMLVCVEIFLIFLVLNSPCFPTLGKKLIFTFALALICGPLIAIGIFFLIKPHIPDHARVMTVEEAGAAVLAGLVCFSGVTFIVYLIDQYFQWRKSKRAQKRSNATVGELDNWDDMSEKSPIEPIPLPSRDGQPSPVVRDYGSGDVLILGLPPKDGEKRITVTVEEESGLVYNFTFEMSLSDCEKTSVYQTLKTFILRRSYELNPDINLTLLKKASTGETLEDTKDLWDNIAVEEEIIATAVSVPPPALWRGKAHFPPENLDETVPARSTVWVDS